MPKEPLAYPLHISYCNGGEGRQFLAHRHDRLSGARDWFQLGIIPAGRDEFRAFKLARGHPGLKLSEAFGELSQAGVTYRQSTSPPAPSP